jgi:hypothetical protein
LIKRPPQRQERWESTASDVSAATSVCLEIGCPTELFYQCMEVSSNGGTPKSSKSPDHVSIETNGFGDTPFQDTTRHICPLVK